MKFYYILNIFNFKANSLNFKTELYIAGGTYELFAGRDASRSLATMTMTVSDTHDTLEDLSENEREKLEHWEKQFTGRHAIDVALLLCLFFKAVKCIDPSYIYVTKYAV